MRTTTLCTVEALESSTTLMAENAGSVGTLGTSGQGEAEIVIMSDQLIVITGSGRMKLHMVFMLQALLVKLTDRWAERTPQHSGRFNDVQQSNILRLVIVWTWQMTTWWSEEQYSSFWSPPTWNIKWAETFGSHAGLELSLLIHSVSWSRSLKEGDNSTWFVTTERPPYTYYRF